MRFNQPVRAGGTSVTLDRMVLSPSETRLYVHGFTPGNGFEPYAPPTVSSITVDGREPVMPDGSMFVQYMDWQSEGPGAVDGENIYHLVAPLSELHGHWAISLHANHAPAPGGGTQPMTWTFRFQL